MSQNVSVAMAAYNGEKYLNDQINSIICQLSSRDELIISLDPSKDTSREIIQSFCSKDARIKMIAGPGRGVIRNFANALEHCQNDIIFLADQDDVWLPGKINNVKRVFEEHGDINVVLHDAFIVNENLDVLSNSFFEGRKCKLGVLNNIIRNSYMGCCMAFRGELLKYILPFPDNLPMHDQWIGLVGEIMGKNYLLEKKLIYYRRHGDNVSSDHHAGIIQMVKWRWEMISSVSKLRKNKNIFH